MTWLRLLIVGIPLLFVESPQAAAEEMPLKMKIVYADSWAPVSFVQDGKAEGLLPRKMEHILSDHLGLDVEHIAVPWGRAQQMVKTGAADGMVTTATSERLTFTNRSSSDVFILPFVVATRTETAAVLQTFNPDDLTLFSGKRFCDVLGNGWAQVFYEEKPVELYIAPTIRECLKLLSFGRVDGIVHAEPVLRHYVKEMALSKEVYVHSNPSRTSPVFPLLISKKSKHSAEMLERFDSHFRSHHKIIHLTQLTDQ